MHRGSGYNLFLTPTKAILTLQISIPFSARVAQNLSATFGLSKKECDLDLVLFVRPVLAPSSQKGQSQRHSSMSYYGRRAGAARVIGRIFALYHIPARLESKEDSKPSEEFLIPLWLSHSACHVFVLELDAIRANPAPK